MNEAENREPKWDKLSVLAHIYMWREKPKAATGESDEAFSLGGEVLVKLCAYVN